MTKILSTLSTFLFLLSPLTTVLADFSGSVEFRAAAFFPSSSLYRDIYDDAGVSYQIEGSTKLCNCLGRWGSRLSPGFDSLDIWANVDWVPQHGHSLGYHNSTNVNIANFSFGLKFPFQLCNQLTAYLGLGPSFGGIWIKNHNCCSNDHASKFAPGVVVKSGINYCICNNIFLDVFVDYLYQRIHFHSHEDIGGVKTGAGIGVVF